MMVRLNSKGMTTVEVILCFVLVSIMSVSMFSTISSYNEKRILEDHKAKVIDYKNILTKEIQMDFIRNGIAQVTTNEMTIANDSMITYTLIVKLNNGESRTLVVKKRTAKSDYHLGGTEGVDDYYSILYGKTDDLVEYPLPNLGSFEVEGRTIQNLSINDVIIEVENHILKIYIGFYHPDLGNRYAIDIVSPINLDF